MLFSCSMLDTQPTGSYLAYLAYEVPCAWRWLLITLHQQAQASTKLLSMDSCLSLHAGSHWCTCYLSARALQWHLLIIVVLVPFLVWVLVDLVVWPVVRLLPAPAW